ncbi:MAG TPA: AIDA repeat-containing protein, partial [Reyranella sp.]
NVIGGIYNTSGSGANPTTYLGVVDLSHVDAAGGLIMPMGSFNFAYALTVGGSVGDTIEGSGLAGNVLGGSIGNDTFVGTAALDQPDTIFTGGGADAIALALGHTASDRIELYAGNSLANAAILTPGSVVASVSGSIVDAADVPQLGWWGQATAQAGGPVSNATTNAGLGTGTSQDMSTVANFAAGSDTIDISLAAFSNLLRNLGDGSAPTQGAAVFSNLVRPGGTVTVANADVLLIDSPSGFLNAAAVAAALVASPITFAGSQTNPTNHYIIAYQDLGGNVRIADMDIHASGAFTSTSQATTLSISDMVQLTGVSLSSLQPSDLTFLAGSASGVVTSGQTLVVSSGQTANGVAVLSGGTVAVQSGGATNATTVSAGGVENVSSGGSASGTVLSGYMEVLAGGAASGTQVASGGTVEILGTASGTAVSSGGRENVDSGGSAIGTTVGNGGVVIVDAGGSANGAVLSSGGVAGVYGTATSATVRSGGEFYVLAGGLANATTVSNGGLQDVQAGATASATVLSSGGVDYIEGVASGTIVLDGGRENVNSGGNVAGTTVSNGGLEIIYAGGVATGIVVSNGGLVGDYGTATGAIVRLGGELDVAAGAVAGGTTVSSGGVQGVLAGATASSTVLSSGGVEFVNGIASGTIVLDGGRENVNSGGNVTGTTVSNGGIEMIYAGGVDSGSIISAGGAVGDYGSSVNDTVLSGGALYVFSGAAVSGATLSGGVVEIHSGANAGQINFTTGGTGGGTLQLDDSVHFGGTIAGFGVPGAIDLQDIAFGPGTTLGFTEAGDNLSGTLTVTDGANTAQIHLLGQYVAGNFHAQADGNGGTLITDPPVVGQYSLYNPHT